MTPTNFFLDLEGFFVAVTVLCGDTVSLDLAVLFGLTVRFGFADFFGFVVRFGFAVFFGVTVCFASAVCCGSPTVDVAGSFFCALRKLSHSSHPHDRYESPVRKQSLILSCLVCLTPQVIQWLTICRPLSKAHRQLILLPTPLRPLPTVRVCSCAENTIPLATPSLSIHTVPLLMIPCFEICDLL